MRGADNLAIIMCRLSGNLKASTSWKPQGFSRPVQDGSRFVRVDPTVIVQFTASHARRKYVNFQTAYSCEHATRETFRKKFVVLATG